MAKKNGRRYTTAERKAILTDMEHNGLTQAAAAKKHGVSTVTIWQWKRASKKTRPRRAKALRTSSSAGSSLDGFADVVRAQVRKQVRSLLPHIIQTEIARALGTKR